MSDKNQKEAVLRYMRQHRTGITTWSAMGIGVTRLSERIRELEAEGHKIKRKWSEIEKGRYGNPVRVMRYMLK